jgi:hypothetical protein
MYTMTTNRIKRTILFHVIPLMLIPALTGCFKSDIAVDIKSNGSGSVGVSAGMTKQAQIVASDQGADPLQNLENTLSGRIGAALTGMEVKRWSEGDYDWVGITKNYESLEQINQVLEGSTLFNRFSLTRKRGILQDEFILDAELPALSATIPLEYSLVDTSTYIQMSFSARLPGQIVESNGAVDAKDPNRLIWQALFSETTSIKARSLAWNWLNIFGILAAVLVFLAVVIGLLAVFYIRQRKHKTNFRAR